MVDLSQMDNRPRILILGGTGDAYTIAERLSERLDLVSISSLAGRLTESKVPKGLVRVGGFGGINGLTTYLVAENIRAVVDATHPFATTISSNAEAACSQLGLPFLPFARSPWLKVEGDRWHEVDKAEDAARYVAQNGGRVFLAIGRQVVSAFADCNNAWFLLRAIEAPERLPMHSHMILQRGPFLFEEELSLLQRYRIEYIVSKNSGGSATYPKIEAARAIGIPVLMIDRPLKHTVSTIQDIDAVLGAIDNLELRPE